jgi:hypothetical protein
MSTCRTTEYTELDTAHIRMDSIRTTFHIRVVKSILTFTDNIPRRNATLTTKVSLSVDTAQYKAVEKYHYVYEYTYTGHGSCYA